MPTPSDPYYNNTVLHLPLDGISRNMAVCYNGPVSASASVTFPASSKYGAACAEFNGVDSKLTIGASISLPGDFCIECWLNTSQDTSSLAVYPRILSGSAVAQATQLQLRIHGSEPIEPGVTPGKFTVYTAGVLIASLGVVNDGLWHHIAVDRSGGVIMLFVDGVSQGTAADATTFTFTNGTLIGSRPDGFGWYQGRIDDFRITIASRYSADFTPPGAIEYFNWDDPANIAPSTAESYTFAPYAPPRSVHLPTVAPDPISGIRGGTEYGGRGRIVGTVKNKGEPSDTPVYRRVRLFKDRDGQCVAETWSDPVTGAYAFENINPAHKYTALSYDHTGQFRAVVADNLTPEVF